MLRFILTALKVIRDICNIGISIISYSVYNGSRYAAY